jgi:hypothetical protein
MTDSPGFLTKTPDELEGFLLELARNERAPTAAHERALLRVAGLSTVAGVVASTKASVAASAAPLGASWLAAKWLAIGLCTSLGTLAIVDQLQRPRHPEPSSQRAPSPSAGPPIEPAPLPVRRERPTPLASVEPIAAAPPRPRSVSAPAPDSSPEIAVHSAREAPSSFDTPPVEQLSRELGALKQARSALMAGRAAQAELVLSQYRAEFPGGVLATEAAALEVETAAALGDRARAAALAEAFLREHPASPLSARVRAVLVAGKKP